MARINKERYVTGNALDAMGLEVGLEFHKTIDYDRKLMRAALVKGGADVRKEARRILSRQAISHPGEMPGELTGRLKRAIGVVSKGTKGGWIKIGPRTISGSVFYPAFLFYGSRKSGLAKRGNYMTAALDNRRETVRGMVRAALKESLVPR